MALRFILGIAGTGKTTYCTDSIINAANAGRVPLFYIVPEQYTLEAEKSLVTKFEGGSVIKAQVLSFERLSYHVISETGARQGDVLDSVGKSMVVRKILHDLSPSLKYYHKTPICAGFVNSISRTIKELYQYEASGAELLIPTFASVHQANKFEDIRLIFNAYKSFIESSYISSDTALDILNNSIDKSKIFDGAIIWMDNFAGFTPQEYRVIGNLLRQADEVNICVNINTAATSYSNVSADDLYYESKFMINKLTEIAKGLGIQILEPVFLADSHRFKNSPQLMHLLTNYEKSSGKPYIYKSEDVRQISLNTFPNKYLEVQATADNIIRLVRDEGLKFHEIAVLPSDMDSYAPILQNTFARYNIPCFVDLRTRILFHPLSEFVRSLFEIVMKNWSHESVLRLLKTGLLDIPDDEIDGLENYVIEYGIRGSKWRKDEWEYGFGENSPYDKDSIHETKEVVFSTINEFSAKLTPKGKIKPSEVCRDIYDFLMRLGIPDKLTTLAMDAANDNDMYLYRIHSGIWNVHMDVLDKIAQIFGDMEMTTTEFADILFMGLSSCDMGIIPPSKDQVIVGDIYRSRLSDIKAMFIIGMTGDQIPKKVEDEGLFDDNDKETLEKFGIELGANSDKQTYINSHMVFRVLTKASDYLHLYYPERSLNGKTNSPSPLLWKINKLFDFGEAEQDEPSDYITLPSPMLGKLRELLSIDDSGAGELGAALAKWYSDSDEYSEWVDNALKGMRAQQALSDSVLNALYGKEIVSSISRIEKYVECPFSYFLRYNLKARERTDYKVRDVDLGNVFHDALEMFSDHLQESGLDWSGLDYEYIDKSVESLFVDFADKGKSDIFSYDAKSAYILEQVKRIAKRSIWALGSHIKSGEFKPLGAEIAFDYNAGMTVDINNERKFILTGRIDRADIMTKGDESYVKIIDYKSGSKAFDVTDIYYGRQLQLLTYMGALTKNGDKILGLPKSPKPGGLFYFKFDDPIANFNTGATDAEIYGDILDKFKMSGLVLNDKLVVEGIDNNIEKNSNIISVGLNKSGEYTSRSGNMVSSEGFERIIDFADKKIGEIGRRIISGEIEAKPYKRGQRTGCDYCPYLAVCGFNEDGKGEYRGFYRVSGLEELK